MKGKNMIIGLVMAVFMTLAAAALVCAESSAPYG
jgi:flagellin-like protein